MVMKQDLKAQEEPVEILIKKMVAQEEVLFGSLELRN
jgi:hypothetical protein